MSTTLSSWCSRAEQTGTALAREYFRMEVGLKYDEARISVLEKESMKHSLFFLNNIKKPDELFSICLGSMADSRIYKETLMLHKLRREKICSAKHRLNRKRVCWTNWREFVVKATDMERKEVFDEFIGKTRLISPIIKKRFDNAKNIYAAYGTDPLTEYLKEHKLSLERLRGIIVRLRDSIKGRFKSQFALYSQKFLGKMAEYYDDFYFMRNRVFEDMVPGLGGINALEQVTKAIRQMGLNPGRIKVDVASRHSKYPSPFCMMIKVPADIRVSYKSENALNDLNSVFHEFGHAMHGCSIDAQLPYWKRYGMSDGLNESFSTFFEQMLLNRDYLTAELKFEPGYASEFIRRANFIRLFSKAFYTGNSLFKIDFWSRNMDFGECDKNYAAQLKQSMGMDIPGEYWKLHHILPDDLVYIPSYLLADINASEMHEHIRDKYGARWWRSKKAGAYIAGLMKPGADSPLNSFSSLNLKKYLRGLLSEC